MGRYAGVVPRYDGLVALVREQYDTWDAPYWNLPSGADPAFAIDDPDGSVLEARWFTPADAVRAIGQVPYPPIAVPAVHYLTHGSRGRDWQFTSAADGWTWDVTGPDGR